MSTTRDLNLISKVLIRVVLGNAIFFLIIFLMSRLISAKLIFAGLITVVFLLLLIEIYLRSLRTQNRGLNSDLILQTESARFDNFEFIKAIEPHVNSAYLTSDFWKEMQIFTGKGSAVKLKSKDNNVIINAKNFDGKFISARDGMRSTTDVPSKVSGRVLLFGGSTVYCFEVPDSFTIASYLQRSLNESGQNLEVLNFGISGVTVSNRIDKLVSIKSISETDIVIFLFGDNDIGWQNFYMKQTLNLKILRALSKFSVLLDWIYFELSAINRRNTARDLADQNVLLLKNLSEKLKLINIRHCFILQPNIYTKKDINKYESNLILRFGNEMHQMARDAYSVYEKNLDPPFASATNLMDRTITSVYLDWAHVNAEGNKIISDFIVGLDIFNNVKKI